MPIFKGIRSQCNFFYAFFYNQLLINCVLSDIDYLIWALTKKIVYKVGISILCFNFSQKFISLKTAKFIRHTETIIFLLIPSKYPNTIFSRIRAGTAKLICNVQSKPSFATLNAPNIHFQLNRTTNENTCSPFWFPRENS